MTLFTNLYCHFIIFFVHRLGNIAKEKAKEVVKMEGGGGGSRKGGGAGVEKDDTVPAAFFAGLKHEKDFSGMFTDMN